MNIELLSLVLQVIALMNLLFIIFTVFIERKKPVSALAWILLLTFLPVVGFIMYLIFGINIRLTNRAEFNSGSYVRQTGLPENGLLSFPERGTGYCGSLIRMHHNLGRCEYTEDNDITIFTNGQDKYEAMLKDIVNAACTVNMLYFIFKNDNIGHKIVDALVKKAREGVTVRVVYDIRGSIKTPYKMFKELIRAGGRVCRIHPFKPGTYFKLNYLNHKKILVVDDNVGYVGGMNIGDEYTGRFKDNVIWRDTHLRITGSAVNALKEKFYEDWSKVSGEKITLEQHISDKSNFNNPGLSEHLKLRGNIGMQIVTSGPYSGCEQIKWGFIKMIFEARNKLYIQTPYFIPDDSFLEALKAAAVSGIDVRIMLPAVPDKKFVYNVTTSYIKELLDFGIKVFLYPGFLHSKMIIMDNRVTSIGTANIDIRSFVLDFEINTFIYNTDFTRKCLEIYEKDEKVSSRITKEWYDSRGLYAKLWESLCRLFSPIL